MNLSSDINKVSDQINFAHLNLFPQIGNIHPIGKDEDFDVGDTHQLLKEVAKELPDNLQELIPDKIPTTRDEIIAEGMKSLTDHFFKPNVDVDADTDTNPQNNPR